MDVVIMIIMNAFSQIVSLLIFIMKPPMVCNTRCTSSYVLDRNIVDNAKMAKVSFYNFSGEAEAICYSSSQFHSSDQ